jgi:peptidoglycan/LPS O-acetylase OafA/YrhL
VKPTYRPEIDGLRAIAVAAVILYHSQINIFGNHLFKGGFIGVDIFFVISGYLITYIILKELVTTGSFSFKHFYQKRVRRILPLLLFVMLASLIFSYFFIFPTSYVNLSKSVLASSFLVSNYYFYFVGAGYDEIASKYIPFLHTWSLSIEQVFYLVFPIFIYLIFKFSFKNLKYFLFTFFFLSFFSSQLTSDSLLNFYSIHTRIWELMVGAIFAYYKIIEKKQKKNETICLISILIIFVSIFYFDLTKYYHVSLLKIFPVLATGGIIYFGSKSSILIKALSSKIFVNIGLISYSLYLWHYPILAFERILDFSDGKFYQFLLAFIIFTLSILTYNFIEKPFRQNKKFTFNFILIKFFLIFLLSLLIILNKGLPERFIKFKEINNNFNIDNFFLSNERSKTINEIHNENYRTFFLNSKQEKIIIIGDSHGLDLFNCFYLNKDLFKDYIFYHEHYETFDRNSAIYKSTENFILSLRWTRRGTATAESLILKLKNDGKKIILTSNTNEYVNYIDNTILDQLILDKKINKLNYFDQKNLYFKNRIINSESQVNIEVKNLAEKYNLKFLNKEDYLCNLINTECDYLTDNGNKIFSDYGHYTLEGAKFFGKRIYETNWLKLSLLN